MKNRVPLASHLKINTDFDESNHTRISKSSAMPEINIGRKIKSENIINISKNNNYFTPKNKKENVLNSNNFLVEKNITTPKLSSNFNVYKSNKEILKSSSNKKIHSNSTNSNLLYTSNDLKSPKNIVNINFNSSNNFNLTVKNQNTFKSSFLSKSGMGIPIENPIEISKLLSTSNLPINLGNMCLDFPQFEPSRCSTKSTTAIKAYAANTYQGIVRNYNEDRVAIILNINRPQNFTGEHWPQCSIFAIYDGHGGDGCSDYLRDNLHEFVVRDPNFPNNPKEAILKGFENAEKDFLNNYALTKNYQIVDRSGSCALFCMILDHTCYIANVGDSRALLSLNNGINLRVLTKDHKPKEEDEEKRITSNGGKIYQ